jgi:O-antigen ligase
MKKLLLILIVLFTSLLGGYLSPVAGISTFFFLITLLLFFSVGSDIQLARDELLSLLFAACGVASVLHAGDKFGAILFSGSFLAGSLFYVTLRNSSDWEFPLLKTIVIGGCIAGFCETLRQVNLIQYGPFYNPNPFSGFLTPLVPISLYLYSKSRKNLYLLLSTLLVFANLISASRTGVATMVLALVAMGLFFYRGKDWSAVKVLLLMFLVGFCSFLLFSLAKDALMLKGVDGMLEKQPTGIIQRAYLLKATLQVIRQAPIFGHGLESFRAVMSTVSNPYVVTPSMHAHSLYLNILAELGLVGLALFLGFLVMVIKGPFYPSFLLKIALLAFLFHNIVEYNFPAPPFQVLFYLLCAAVIQRKAPKISLLRVKGRVASIIPPLLGIYFIAVHLFPAIGLILLGRAGVALQERDVVKTLKYLFASTYFGYSVSLLHADTAQLITDIYFSTGLKKENSLEIAEKNYLKALALNSMDGPLYVKAADFYARTGRPAEAERYLLAVIDKFPYHQQYRLALARFYAGQGWDQEAVQILEASEQFLKKFAPLNPGRLNALSGLAASYRRHGDMERAEEFAGKARRLEGLVDGPSNREQNKP